MHYMIPNAAWTKIPDEDLWVFQVSGRSSWLEWISEGYWTVEAGPSWVFRIGKGVLANELAPKELTCTKSTSIVP